MSNKDDFDTTYRKVKGFHIIGYDGDTDTFNKLHIDQNGQIYAKMLSVNEAGAMQELVVGQDGRLKVNTEDLSTKEILEQVLIELKTMNLHLQAMTDEKFLEGDTSL